MSSSWHCWSLSSLLLLLGRNLGVHIEVHQDSVNGTVGHPALLPISYRFDDVLFAMSVSWTFRNSSDALATCTVKSCSLDAKGAPTNCSAESILPPTYSDRATLFPLNGSLLLRDLRLSDDGVYTVTFVATYQSRNGPSEQKQQSRNITLTVHEQRFSPEHPAGNVPQNHIWNYTIGICSSASFLLLLLLFCCRRHRAAQQQKRKITDRQQVSCAEEAPTESAVWATVPIYASVRESSEQPPPRPTSEVVYTSVTFPDPPGRSTRPYHLLI